jgi:membrane peptidoglycan carboxypeptidase
MNGKTISSEFPRALSSASRFFWFVNRQRLKRWLWWLAALLVVFLCAFIEFQTSALQSWIFTSTNERVHYSLGDGPSKEIAFPRSAPFDDRRGYSKLPLFQARLEAQKYSVTKQVRQSETMRMLFEHGISPPYPEWTAAGLEVQGVDGVALFRYGQAEFLFEKNQAIPPLLVKTLLFLENRDLDNPATPWQNPVIEWDRTVKAAMMYIAAKLNLPVPVQGGSTLAVQLEKFRHSPHGRTDTPLEKLRQIIGASLKAYHEGANTRPWRERIILDYLNTVPLAAAPGYGEIHGLGEGLHAWFGIRLQDAVAALNSPNETPEKLGAFKHILSLLISVRAPSDFLIDERESLEEKVDQFTRLMARAGIIDWEFAADLQETPIHFLPTAPLPPQPSSSKNKAANAIRTNMMEALGVGNLYDLNRLHLQVGSTFDVPLQKEVTDFLNRLADPQFVKAHALNGDRLLEMPIRPRSFIRFCLSKPRPPATIFASKPTTSRRHSILTKVSSSSSVARRSSAPSRTTWN